MTIYASGVEERFLSALPDGKMNLPYFRSPELKAAKALGR